MNKTQRRTDVMFISLATQTLVYVLNLVFKVTTRVHVTFKVNIFHTHDSILTTL